MSTRTLFIKLGQKEALQDVSTLRQTWQILDMSSSKDYVTSQIGITLIARLNLWVEMMLSSLD